jgi:hypothetical protein
MDAILKHDMRKAPLFRCQWFQFVTHAAPNLIFCILTAIKNLESIAIHIEQQFNSTSLMRHSRLKFQFTG